MSEFEPKEPGNANYAVNSSGVRIVELDSSDLAIAKIVDRSNYNPRVNGDGVELFAAAGGGGGGGTIVIDNLTSTSTTSALSANMGRVLGEELLGAQSAMADLKETVLEQ